MTDAPFRSTRAHKREISSDKGTSLLGTMAGLWPYIWPRDRRDLKLRIWIAMALLLFAKLATIAVPFTFKWATDALVGEGSAPVAPSSWLVWALAAPIMQLVPTAIELALIVAVLLYQFDWRYVVVILITVACYMVFSYLATEWRINIRRRMNDSDTDANVKAIDSLLNYETVKYFVAEEREAARYDRSMARYEEASVQAYVSLAVLNAGQATIFTIGLAAVMVMCAYGIKEGTNTIGDFVMINAMMIQLYQPLNFMGMVYREIKQAMIDIETMFSILARKPEIEDKPGAPPL